MENFLFLIMYTMSMQIIIYILGIFTGWFSFLLVIYLTKRYNNNINYYLDKPLGEAEIIGYSDEQSTIVENLKEADENNLDIIIN